MYCVFPKIVPKTKEVAQRLVFAAAGAKPSNDIALLGWVRFNVQACVPLLWSYVWVITSGGNSVCSRSPLAKKNVLSAADDARVIFNDPKPSSKDTSYPGAGRNIEDSFSFVCNSVASESGVYDLLAKKTRFNTF